jgi:hypothetical protein
MDKLVHQLPGVVTFAYDLHFRCKIAHWKGITEDINFGGSIMTLSITEKLDPENFHLDPQNGPGS